MGARHDGPSGIGAKLNDAVQWYDSGDRDGYDKRREYQCATTPMPTDAVSIEAIKLVVTSNKKISVVMGSSGISHRAS